MVWTLIFGWWFNDFFPQISKAYNESTMNEDEDGQEDDMFAAGELEACKFCHVALTLLKR